MPIEPTQLSDDSGLREGGCFVHRCLSRHAPAVNTIPILAANHETEIHRALAAQETGADDWCPVEVSCVAVCHHFCYDPSTTNCLVVLPHPHCTSFVQFWCFILQ